MQRRSQNSLSNIRRASTSSNDSSTSLCSAPLGNHSEKNHDSLGSSEHSSLSSNHSLSSFPDRNNNIKNATNGHLKAQQQSSPSHVKLSPTKKRVLSTPTNNSRIPKSNSSTYKSTSSIPQLTLSSKIPCLDATNKLRYSTHNIYLASSQETPDKTDLRSSSSKRLSLSNTPTTTATTPKQRVPRVSNLNRYKQKSSLELNVSNENFYSLTPKEKSLEQVPNSQSATKTQKGVHHQQQLQHRRHHSISSLPRVGKCSHNSPVTTKRPTSGSDTRNNQLVQTPKLYQGSASSLNSTASTGSTNSSSSSLNTTVPSTTTIEHKKVPPGPRPSLAKVLVSSPGGPFGETTKKSFHNTDKKMTSPMVDVCSWLERNHLAS